MNVDWLFAQDEWTRAKKIVQNTFFRKKKGCCGRYRSQILKISSRKIEYSGLIRANISFVSKRLISKKKGKNLSRFGKSDPSPFGNPISHFYFPFFIRFLGENSIAINMVAWKVHNVLLGQEKANKLMGHSLLNLLIYLKKEFMLHQMG